MRLDTANIITAARVACGRWYKNGDKYNNVIPTSNQVITDENQVWAHDLKLTALLRSKVELFPSQTIHLKMVMKIMVIKLVLIKRHFIILFHIIQCKR